MVGGEDAGARRGDADIGFARSFMLCLKGCEVLSMLLGNGLQAAQFIVAQNAAGAVQAPCPCRGSGADTGGCAARSIEGRERHGSVWRQSSLVARFKGTGSCLGSHRAFLPSVLHGLFSPHASALVCRAVRFYHRSFCLRLQGGLNAPSAFGSARRVLNGFSSFACRAERSSQRAFVFRLRTYDVLPTVLLPSVSTAGRFFSEPSFFVLVEGWCTLHA